MTPQSIEKVVPHPKEASFAVFCSSTIVDEEHRTRISIFLASSNTPTSIRALPFGLRNVVWASFNSRPGFNLVGITHSWRAVTIGDSEQTLTEDGLTAKAMNNHSQQLQRRTLFQDIFGASAFASVSSDTPQTASLQRKDKIHDVFDTPAYLAPSFDFLFEPLIKSFLTPRPSEPIIMDDTVENDTDEDIVMEEEQGAVTSVLSGHPSRTPHPGEMEAFTKLFRARCMTGRNISCAFYLDRRPNQPLYRRSAFEFASKAER